MQKIRILMCGSSRTEKGGMNSVIDQLMDHEWGQEIQMSYLPTHISGNVLKKSLYFVIAYLRLLVLLVGNKFDIIHIHMSYKGSFHRKYLVAKCCKRYNKKVIIHLHGSEFKDFYNSGDEKLKSKVTELFTIIDKVIVLGKEWEKFLTQIAPKANVVIINNAIAIPEFEAKQRNDKMIFLFLGALIKRKGAADLLHAVKAMLDMGDKNFEVWIAGAGEEEQKLAEYSTNFKMNTVVKFLGWINGKQKMNLLQQADVLVLPSYNEGLPIAILEAISYGMPVISTNVGSIAEAVIPSENGCLIEPGDISGIKSSMSILLNDKLKWEEFSRNSRKIAEKKFSDNIFFGNIKDLYFALEK